MLAATATAAPAPAVKNVAANAHPFCRVSHHPPLTLPLALFSFVNFPNHLTLISFLVWCCDFIRASNGIEIRNAVCHRIPSFHFFFRLPHFHLSRALFKEFVFFYSNCDKKLCVGVSAAPLHCKLVTEDRELETYLFARIWNWYHEKTETSLKEVISIELWPRFALKRIFVRL